MEWLVYLHVLSVVIWIGGVAFVTAIVFPVLARMEDSMAKVSFFIGFEKRFQLLAKFLVVLVGFTGIILFFHRGGFMGLAGEEMMLLGYKFFIWLFYFVLLFGAEKRLMSTLVSPTTPVEKAFKRLTLFHWSVLTLSLLAIIAGIRLVRG
ncbi:MAG: hypothetical protein FJ106_05200 [Deltaproteobacteria bacterium]|nr:hypothetical protein [Deltaproteobacteria bacterium]